MKQDRSLWSWVLVAGLLLTAWGPAWADPTNLSSRVMLQASTIAGQINGKHYCPQTWPSGAAGAGAKIINGYCSDGYSDCYGFVRRAWNPFLAGQSAACLKKAGTTLASMPVGDAPDAAWTAITNPASLVPGDALATAQGHAWGDSWHGGLFYGGASGSYYQYFDDENSGATSAVVRNTNWWNGFHYYYKPTHYLLQNNPCP